MPLSAPADRELIHTRTVECKGYRRADGLWDIEGHLVDTKSYSFASHDRVEIKAGEPIHQMWLRLTIDDDHLIHRAEAVIDHGPFHLCPTIAPEFSKLEGLSIRPGFTRKVREMFGGTRGCTHLVELLGPLGTTAYQTLYARREEKASAEPERKRPRLIDTCHALASDSPAVKRMWPDFYTGE